MRNEQTDPRLADMKVHWTNTAEEHLDAIFGYIGMNFNCGCSIYNRLYSLALKL
jgi:hypothetical protein